jgi:hypothetical protein
MLAKPIKIVNNFSYPWLGSYITKLGCGKRRSPKILYCNYKAVF